MKLSLDRALKLLWLSIGALLLLFLAAGAVMMVSQAIRNAGARDDAVRVASEDRPARQEARAIRYGEPAAIRGTATRIVLVEYGTGYEYGRGVSGYAGDRRAGAAVNVIFVDAEGARLLFDRPAFIREVSYPRAEDENEAPRGWITYVAAMDDTNRNGRMEELDAAGLYVTDLDGRNLRPVLAPPLRYLGHSALDPARILVYALEPPAGAAVEEERMRQRAFIYDVGAGRLSPYAALDSAAAQAGRILQR